MISSTQNRRRFFAAWSCLLAVALLYAPLAGAAWSSRAMACCTEDHCNVPRHHHQKKPTQSECGHDLCGLSDCSISCSQNPDGPVVTAVAFVLPTLTFASAPVLVTRTVGTLRSVEIPRSVEPLSPPPRVAVAAR
jgi:hypothetical protein